MSRAPSLRLALWLGVTGSLLLTAGQWTWGWPITDPHAPSWVQSLRRAAPVGHVATVVGLALSVVAWWLARPRDGYEPSARLWWAWVAPLLLAPPILSRDGFAYAAQGWQVLHGLDPYSVPMGSQGPFGPLVDGFWSNTTTIYPAGTLFVQAAVVALGGGQVMFTILLIRLPALLAVLGCWMLVPRLAARWGARGSTTRWLTVFSPFATVYLVGGCHNDAYMVLLVLAALYVATTRAGWVTAAVIVGLAATMKQPALLAAVTVSLLATRERSTLVRVLTGAASVALATATYAALTVATLGFGWVGASGSPINAFTQAPACLLRIVIHVSTGASHPFAYSIVNPIFLGLLAVALVVTWWRSRHDPGSFHWRAYGLVALLGPTLHPWYLTYALMTPASPRFSTRTVRIVAGWLVTVVFASSLAEAFGTPTLTSFFYTLPLGVAIWWWLGRQDLDELSPGDADGALPVSHDAADHTAERESREH